VDIRKTLREKPAIGLVVVVATFALAGLILRECFFSNSTARLKVFFSDDDGQTWFADSFIKFSPFDHGGKQAYRAHVFRCGDGPPFLGYLEAYPEAVRPVLESAHADPNSIFMALQANSDKSLVKKPGETKWVGPRARAYQSITTPRCPDGSTTDPEETGPGG